MPPYYGFSPEALEEMERTASIGAAPKAVRVETERPPMQMVVVVLDAQSNIVAHRTEDDSDYRGPVTTVCGIQRSWVCAMEVVTAEIVWSRCPEPDCTPL